MRYIFLIFLILLSNVAFCQTNNTVDFHDGNVTVDIQNVPVDVFFYNVEDKFVWPNPVNYKKKSKDTYMTFCPIYKVCFEYPDNSTECHERK